MSSPEVVESGRLYNALWWAKVQSAGPLQVSPDTPAVSGLTRAAEPDSSSVWMLPTLPDGAGHGVLEELGMPPVAVEMPNETARVLAICVACCWPDRSGSAWPGVTGTLTQIKAVYAGLRGRPEQSSDLTLIIGSLRRLHATSWLLWNEKPGEVRLGPRVITWTPSQLTILRELCRILPDPPPAVLTAKSPPEATPDPLPSDPDLEPHPLPSEPEADPHPLPSEPEATPDPLHSEAALQNNSAAQRTSTTAVGTAASERTLSTHGLPHSPDATPPAPATPEEIA